MTCAGPHVVSDEDDAGMILSVRRRETLVAEHLGLAEVLARRFANRGEPYDDLVQVASLALVRAVDRFDPERGVEFSTYATRTILGELKHHFRDKGWTVRAPRRLQELYLQVNGVVSTLSQELGRSPTVHEIAEACGTRDEDVLAAIEAGQAYRSASLEAPTPGGDTLGEHVVDDHDETASFDERTDLAMHLAHLTPRERLIIQLRFEDELTQSEIGIRLGLSQMQVSRLLRGALDALRRAYREEE